MSETDSPTAPDAQLDAKDLKVLLVWILIGLAGAGVAFRYFFQAFPEASVDFRVSRTAALDQARGFLTAQGANLEAYHSSIIFSVDDNAKTYLEREVGLEQANRLMASEVSVWYWKARFFIPGQQEEYSVRVSPAGRVVGMTHTIEEARAGASLEREAARAKADSYLRTLYGAEFASYDYLSEEANSNERPHRRDWSFTWERRGFKAKDAPYRLHVTVQGDEIGHSDEELKVPEAWQRSFERLRSSNIFYQVMGEVPGYFLVGAIFFVLFQQGRRGTIQWRGALKLGVVVAILFFAMEANQWPLTRFGYDTKSSYQGFFVQQMGLAALGALALGLLIALAFAAGEPLYRQNQPAQLRLSRALSLPGIRSKEFFRSAVIGLAMAAGHIGFVVLFYVVGQKLGVWAPQDIKYTNVASTALPWLSPLATSFLAANAEEFIFRLFAIPFLHRLTRSWVVAIVLPAFIWGFGHSAYTVEPGYIRGIEVGLIGIVAGLVMLRYGILTTVFWHYTVDATLIGLFLLRSESLYFRISGALVGAGVLIPLGMAVVSYVTRGRFETDETLLNRSEPPVEISLTVETAPAAVASEAAGREGGYQALSMRTLGILFGCGTLGALLLATVKPQAIGDFVRFSVDVPQATAKADEILRARNINPARYRRAVTSAFTFNPYANEYLRRQVGITGANRLYQEKVPSAFWRVRYFRDSEKEEYVVILRPDGALHSIRHDLEEKAPGANLSKEAALARAEAYVRDEKKLDLTRWKLTEAESDKRPARTDHTFTWEENDAIGEAHVRAQVKVQGDEVSGYRVFVKIPEEWQRRQSQRTLASIIHLVGHIALYVILGITVLVIFFKNLKQPAAANVPWKRLAGWALWALLAAAIVFSSGWRALLSAYPTQFPLKTFLAIEVIVLVFAVAAICSLIVFMLGLGWFFMSRAFGGESVPAWRGMPAAYYRDAFSLGLAGTLALLGLERLPVLLERFWPTAQKALDAGVPTGLEAVLPSAASVAGAVGYGLFFVGLIAVAAGFVAADLRAPWLRFGLIVLLAVAWSGGWGSPADFAKRLLIEAVTLGVVWWGVTRLVRFNLLGYFLLSVLGTLCVSAVGLLEQPTGFFRANGWAVVVAIVLLLAWPLVSWRRAAA